MESPDDGESICETLSQSVNFIRNMSDSMRKRIINSIKDKVPGKDHFDDHYKIDESVPPRNGRTGIVVKCQELESGQVRARKLVQLGFQYNYDNQSYTRFSQSDTNAFCNFIECCQEAVLQADIFSHENIVRCNDYWIVLPDENSQRDVGKHLTTIIEFLQDGGPDTVLTSQTREAIRALEGM